jgi:lactoylglutathione lyase
MSPEAAPKKTGQPERNVEQAVPFLRVSNLQTSLRFYVDGLGFTMAKEWIDDGKLRWCWLQLGGAALMLQEFPREGHDSWTPSTTLGEGVSICFQCRDALALFHEFTSRGIEAGQPFVGNAMWVTAISDPDGIRRHICFRHETVVGGRNAISIWRIVGSRSGNTHCPEWISTRGT